MMYVFYRVYKTLYITACSLNLLLFMLHCESACTCNLYFQGNQELH